VDEGAAALKDEAAEKGVMTMAMVVVVQRKNRQDL
jgi:hypothetical protein